MNKIKLLSSVFCASVLCFGIAHAKSYDFDGVTAGQSIDKADSTFSVINLDGSNISAVVSSEEAYSGSNAVKLLDESTSTKVYLRKPFAKGPATEGKVSVKVYTSGRNTKSTYIAIGRDVTVDGVERYLEIQSTGSGKVKFEAGKSDPEVGQVQRDSWNEYVIEWAEGSFSLTINGKLVDDGLPIVDPDNVPTSVIIYTGDNKSTGNTAYIDDLTSDLF
jgi:hypothetical protein